MKIEIIVTNVSEAIVAEKNGADRLELIDSFACGGLSPSLTLSQQVCAAVNIPVCVMVRPHGESFNYNDSDIQQIIHEIIYLRDETSAAGIVFGALTKNHELDHDALKEVLANKGRLSITFHRAIDAAVSPLNCLQKLLNYDAVDLVLTSGGEPTAIEGIETIKAMVRACKNTRTNILAGSGITPENALNIVEATGVEQIHIGSGVRTHDELDPEKFIKLKDI
jgi:copper homeostasis protein